MLTHKRESCEACYRHVSIRRALTEELFTDPVFRSMCFNRFKIYLLYFSVVCLFFLMDTVVNFFLVEAETRRRWDIFQAEVTLY